MNLRLIISVTLLLHFSVCSAQLQPMDDGDLEQVSGQVGIVLDGLKLVADPYANLQLSFDTDIAADGGSFDNVSIVGSGNGAACDAWNNGALPSLGGCNGINIGSSTDPITFDVDTESGVSYIQLKTPTTWTSGIDLNFRLVAYGQGFDKNNSGTVDATESNLIFADPVWVQAKGIRLPSTELRVWSDSTKGFSFKGNINLSIDELNIDYSNSRPYNTITQSYEAFAPNSGGDGPRSGSGFTGADGSKQGVIKLTDISVTNLALGVFPSSGLTFGSIDNGVSNQPGFYVDMPLWTATQANGATGYYAEVPKTDISIGGFELGRTVADPLLGYSIGPAAITGVRIQHLRIELGS
jgi:hypothetical protein